MYLDFQVGPRFFSSAPPRSPAPPFDHFPFGPAILRRRVSRALGCGGIFPRDQQAGARVRKRRREGNEWAARVGRRYTIQRAIRWLKNREGGTHNFLRVRRQDRRLLPAI